MALPDSEVENFFGTFFLLFAIVLALVVIFEVAKRIWPGFGLLISAHQDANNRVYRYGFCGSILAIQRLGQQHKPMLKQKGGYDNQSFVPLFFAKLLKFKRFFASILWYLGPQLSWQSASFAMRRSSVRIRQGPLFRFLSVSLRVRSTTSLKLRSTRHS